VYTFQENKNVSLGKADSDHRTTSPVEGCV
jgi:hypothetical protein